MFNFINKFNLKILLILLFLFSQKSYSQELTDPTRPYDYVPKSTAVPVAAGTPLYLYQVSVRDGYRSAIINNILVKTGDKFGEYIVREIDQYSVRLLSRDGKFVKLSIFDTPDLPCPVNLPDVLTCEAGQCCQPAFNSKAVVKGSPFTPIRRNCINSSAELSGASTGCEDSATTVITTGAGNLPATSVTTTGTNVNVNTQ